MVVIFDLDDTLYPETDYVRSGLKAVAEFIAHTDAAPAAACFNHMWNHLQRHGRGTVFDALLSDLGILTRRRVRQCISVYRHHVPRLTLYPDADACLRAFHGRPVYIVTDGNKLVQRRKLLALGLLDRVDHCYVTHHYGRHRAKPSPYCFDLIAHREGVSARQVVYIADDPTKDFVGLKPRGFRTIRIMRGRHAQLTMAPNYEAELRVPDLSHVTPAFIDTLTR
jgi:putative hydrolase of the HAD superfamily